MKKVLFPLLMSILLLSPLSGEELKTRDDFAPAPPAEQPLTGLFPMETNPQTGLIVSSAAAVCGLTLAAAAGYSTLGRAADDPGSQDLQTGLPLLGLSLVGTAVSTVLIEYFIDRIREEKRESTSAR